MPNASPKRQENEKEEGNKKERFITEPTVGRR